VARLFVAVKMPPEVQDEIARIQSELKKHTFFEGQYVDPAIAHTTIAFIGDVAEDAVDQIKKALSQVKASKMSAQLAGVNCFRHGDNVRLVYLSFICEELALLALQIEEVLAPWKKKKKCDFVSHVTLARVKKVYNLELFLEVLHAVTVYPIAFSLESFTLEQSVLLPAGPEYETRARYFLL
jgi:2'-5' RNA ligase